jgi:predicted alpha/beta hydrolase
MSEPILSSEGFHVVMMKHEGQDRSDPRSHKTFAQITYQFELARQVFEQQVAAKTRLIYPLEDMLK